jgi:FkbM family methyltransferase
MTTGSGGLTQELRALWNSGDWNALRDRKLDQLDPEPARAELALLLAAAHFHVADPVMTRACLRQARNWGANPAQVRAILFAGLHNTLGRTLLAVSQEDEALTCFETALHPAADGLDTTARTHLRRAGQAAQMGALQAAVGHLSDAVETEAARPAPRPERLQILEYELGLLKSELILALEKNQLGGEKTAAPEEDPAAYAKAHSVSQLGQDVWALEQTGFKRGGFFVEFGATNGILLSNSYLLEAGFDWQGICAEPNPQFFDQLRRNRRCQVSDACIAGETGREVSFILADVYGGISDYADIDTHDEKRQAYLREGAVTTLRTISLHDFLHAHNAPRQIDFLSIDTEGSEYEILAAFPFEDWDVKLIAVEHNNTPAREKIFELLSAHGYERTEARWDDWYRLKESDAVD